MDSMFVFKQSQLCFQKVTAESCHFEPPPVNQDMPNSGFQSACRNGLNSFATCIHHGSHQCKIIFGAPFLSFCVSLLLQDCHFSGRTWWWSITGCFSVPNSRPPFFVDEIIIFEQMPLCNYSMLESPLKAMYRWCPRKNGHRSVIKKKKHGCLLNLVVCCSYGFIAPLKRIENRKVGKSV